MGRAWTYPLPFIPIMPSDSAGLLDAQHKAARCRCREGRVKPGWRREGAPCQAFIHEVVVADSLSQVGHRAVGRHHARAFDDPTPTFVTAEVIRNLPAAGQ
jgi:hypothetical protein